MEETKKLEPSAGTKRPAKEQAAPAMTKEASSKAFQSLSACIPKKPKSQSTYVRFKAIMLQDAHDKGDSDTVKNITQKAKEAWNDVKYVLTSKENSTSNSSADKTFVDMKRRAEENEREEQSAYDAKLNEWRDNFQVAAGAHLSWLTLEATVENRDTLRGVIKIVEGFTEVKPNKALADALKQAKSEFSSLEAVAMDKNLVNKLRGASDEVLLQHAQKYREALKQAKMWQILNARTQAAKERKEQEEHEREEGAIKAAKSSVKALIKDLEKQIVYNGNSNIQSCMDGVTPRIFCAMFDVPDGTTETIIPSSQIKTKTLRYGGVLMCSDVNVKLNVDEQKVSATASFRLFPHMRF